MKLVNIFKNHWLLIIIWSIGLFLRCYRQPDLLGFYYDQGRDAQIAADIISGKNFPAIGPTTGIAGLFLGPIWYYLITPGYLIGQGDPAIASYFISFLESLTIPLIFFLVKTYWRNSTAYLATILWAFSFYLIRSSRWFSNPSPLPTLVLLSMFLLIKIIHEKKYKLLPVLAFVLGVSLQLEAASAIFFFPVILLYFILNSKTVLKIKISVWLQSIFAFGVLLLPQLAFEIKNNFITTKNFIGFLTGKVNSDTGSSWAIPNIDFIIKRFSVYYETYFSKLDTGLSQYSLFFLAVFLIGLVYIFIKFKTNSFIKLQLLWLLVPSFILLFFVGNYGVLYDYYLTGFFPAFIIIFAIIITLPKQTLFKFFSIFLVCLYFINGNFTNIKGYLTTGLEGPEQIVLGNELAAVDFICQKNNQQIGNFDVYVPPVIAHSYRYLIYWRQNQNKCAKFDESPNKNVYIITEVDPPHPERLQNWFSRYNRDKVIINQKFGGVTVWQLTRY